MNIDIDLLKTFLEVNRTRHFGQAAENLYVTQSTVSARIKLLENVLGTAVFIRNRNDIQLTPTGRKFIQFAEAIIVTWNRARQEIALPDESKLTLTVGGMPSLWDIVLQDWLQDTYSRFSDLHLDIEVLGAESVTRKLQEGTLDLAFTFEAPLLTHIDSLDIMRIPLIMVSNKTVKNTQEALQHNYIRVDWGTSFSLIHASHFGDSISPVMHTSLGRLARDFIIHNGGTCYLAEPMVQDALNQGLLFEVPGAPIITRNAYALFPVNSAKKECLNDILTYFSH